MYTMSTSKSRSYHHGDLKAALIDAAEALLEEGGTGAISLREAARRAGVSAMAPYRHFADKEALVAALATRAFQDFGKALGEAVGSSPDPFAAMGQAYVRFALARPGRFRLIFGGKLPDRSRHKELDAAARQTFDQLVDAARAAGPSGTNARILAIRAWAMVHGLSHLLLDGLLPDADPEGLARAVTTVSRRG
jgi:AcrR family transcriptional regulator